MSRASSRTKLTSKQPKKKQSSTVDLDVKKIEIPQLAWKVISEQATGSLMKVKDIDEVARKLANILSLTKSEDHLKEAAELDFFVAGFWCASSEWQLTNEQVSAFVTLLQTVLYNLKKKKLSLSENVRELHTLMANVGIANVPSALECFTSEVATTALHYIQTTLFQHYTLFQYLFTEELETETHTAQLTVEVPNSAGSELFPFPLEESIPLELYLRCKASDPKEDELDSGQEVATQEESEDAVTGADVATISSLDEDEIQISSKQLKIIMEDLAKKTLEPFQVQMFQKIKDKEDLLASRLSKLEKSLNVV